MFAEMEGAFLPRPTVEVKGQRTVVTLQNMPTLSAADHRLLAALGNTDMSTEDLRVLLITALPPILLQGADTEEMEAASADGEKLGADGGKLDPGSRALPEDLLTAIDQLGSRSRKESIRGVIRAICTVKPWTTREEIAKHLPFSQKKLGPKHLTPMVDAGWLELRYPQQPTHPHQAYRSTPASHGDRQPEGAASASGVR